MINMEAPIAANLAALRLERQLLAAEQEFKPLPYSATQDVVPLWINGKETTTTLTHPVISPLTNEPIYDTACASRADVDDAISAAQAALPSWRATPPWVRRDIFLRAADELEKKKAEHWSYYRREIGAPISHFEYDWWLMIEGIRTMAGLIHTALKGESPVAIAQEGRNAQILREPHGVILGISPWNAPNCLGTRSFLGPIAMGNTAIFKSSERCPASSTSIVSAFHAAGLPAGVLNLVVIRPSDAAFLTAHMINHSAIRKINFTGSTGVGSTIAATAGRALKPAVMELGGKAAAIVCEDADLELAAEQCALGAFGYSGQICMATERILVNKKVAAPFKEKLVAATQRLFGAEYDDDMYCIMSETVRKNKALVRDALAKGARALYGDVDEVRPVATAMRPIIVDGVTADMDIYHTESFGPTVSVIDVDSDEAALEIANHTEYGLNGAVFTTDLNRGFRIAKTVECGSIHINSMSVHDEPCIPHGGIKSSGWGRFSDIEGLREWIKLRVVTWMD